MVPLLLWALSEWAYPCTSLGITPATDLHREYDASCRSYAYTQSSQDSPTYQWFTTPEIRQAGRSNLGNSARLRVAMDRFLKGGNLSVAMVGGSISAGNGASDGRPLSNWLQEILYSTYGALPGVRSRVTVQTAAIAGTWSSYMSLCHAIHLPVSPDVIFVDYAVNDPEAIDGLNLNNQPRKAFERLLRSLLNKPNRPAVVLLNAYQWFTMKVNGTFHTVVERDFQEFAMYYGLPALSVKACCWRLMYRGG